jgi:hypothetical protein
MLIHVPHCGRDIFSLNTDLFAVIKRRLQAAVLPLSHYPSRYLYLIAGAWMKIGCHYPASAL